MAQPNLHKPVERYWIVTPQLVTVIDEDIIIINYIKKVFPNNYRVMIAIAKAESGLNLKARNNSAIEDSRGIFQINTIVHKADCDLYTYKCNINKARKIYDTQGIRAWGAFTDGRYLQYL